MDVLLVVPDVSRYNKTLRTEDELYAATRVARVTVLSGNNATIPRLRQELNGHRFDVLQFSTEALQDANNVTSALAMTDGVLTMGELGQMLSVSSVDAIFLNACNTSLIGSFLVYTGAVSVAIVTNVPLPDGVAGDTPYVFYDRVAEMVKSSGRAHWGRALSQAMRNDQIGWYSLLLPLDGYPIRDYSEDVRNQVYEELFDHLNLEVEGDRKRNSVALLLFVGLFTLFLALSAFLVVRGLL